MNPNSARTESFRKALQQNGLDAAVVQLPENVLFLSGFWPMIGMSVMIFPVEGRPRCIIPECYVNEAEAELRYTDAVYYNYGLADSPDPQAELIRIIGSELKSLGVGTAGVELSYVSTPVSWNSAEFIAPLSGKLNVLPESGLVLDRIADITPVIQQEKLIKTDWEASMIRRANETACTALDAFYSNAVPGISGIELVAEIERAVMKDSNRDGRRRARAYAQVAVGPEEGAVAYRPNEISTSNVLREGDTALLELGICCDGFWADRTRTAVAGMSTSEQADVWETVRLAQQNAIEAVRPGVKASDIDSAARSVIIEAGYGKAFPHITGHGVGFSYHEPAPFISPGNGQVIRSGMVFTIEPGIYFPGFGGIRIEDNILVTDDGAEILGPFKNKL